MKQLRLFMFRAALKDEFSLKSSRVDFDLNVYVFQAARFFFINEKNEFFDVLIRN